MHHDSGKESTIELLGIVGIVITAACLVQHLFLVRYVYQWIPFALALVDVFVLMSFIGFYKMKTVSVPLLAVSVGALIIEQAAFLSMGGILWLAILLTAYSIIVLVLIYIQELNKYIKEHEAEERSDAFIY